MKQNITLIALILWTTALVSAQDLSFEQNFEQEVVWGYLKICLSKTKHPTPTLQTVCCIPTTIQKKASTTCKGNCCGKARIKA